MSPARGARMAKELWDLGKGLGRGRLEGVALHLPLATSRGHRAEAEGLALAVGVGELELALGLADALGDVLTDALGLGAALVPVADGVGEAVRLAQPKCPPWRSVFS